jgi:hypothetical protein
MKVYLRNQIHFTESQTCIYISRSLSGTDAAPVHSDHGAAIKNSFSRHDYCLNRLYSVLPVLMSGSER